MWATLTLMSALSLAPAADAGDLQLTNARVTHGPLGPTRQAAKFLPGDVYFVSFDIEGLQYSKDGYARWSEKFKLYDPSGKLKHESLEQDYDLFAIQGGGRLAKHLHAEVDANDPPGEYTMQVFVTDRATKKKATLTRKYEVAEKAFGVVRLACSYVPPGPNGPVMLAPGLGSVGQVLFFNYGVTGFERDPKTKQPSLRLEINMRDEAGKPTLENAFAETVPGKDDSLPEKLALIPLYNTLALTKPGKYTVELKATDQVSKKTATVTYPLVVVDSPK